MAAVNYKKQKSYISKPQKIFWSNQGMLKKIYPPNVVFISDDHVINATSLR